MTGWEDIRVRYIPSARGGSRAKYNHKLTPNGTRTTKHADDRAVRTREGGAQTPHGSAKMRLRRAADEAYSSPGAEACASSSSTSTRAGDAATPALRGA
ncbi:hypothetical protein GCM10025773_21870 [Microbacterium jejuense]